MARFFDFCPGLSGRGSRVEATPRPVVEFGEQPARCEPVYPAGKQPVNTGADGGYPALKTEFDRGEVEADVMVIFRMQSP